MAGYFLSPQLERIISWTKLPRWPLIHRHQLGYMVENIPEAFHRNQKGASNLDFSVTVEINGPN